MARKSLNTCGVVVLLPIIILIAVFLSLYFTILKPRPPQIVTHPATLHNVTFGVFPAPSLNATLNFTLTVKNPNYGDCRYDGSVAKVYYRGSPAAEIPIGHGALPARGEHDIIAFGNLSGDKVIESPGFFEDYGAGVVNFTAVAKMPTRVRVLKILKLHVTVVISCDLSVLVFQSFDVLSTCTAKLKF